MLKDEESLVWLVSAPGWVKIRQNIFRIPKKWLCLSQKVYFLKDISYQGDVFLLFAWVENWVFYASSGVWDVTKDVWKFAAVIVSRWDFFDLFHGKKIEK